MIARLKGLICVGAAPFIAALACSGAKPTVPAVPSAKPPAASSSSSFLQTVDVPPRVCNGRRLVGSLVEQLADRAQTNADKQEEKAQQSGQKQSTDSARPGGSFEKAYRMVAPATVVIDSSKGFGSGVILDKSGLILTNYHVVAHGMQKDFTVKVSLNFGKPSRTGGVELSDTRYDGYVVKADRVRDLALIRVKDAPKNITIAKISGADPTPGQPVAAIGHAGIGMLWAIKSCHVAAIGEPAKNSLVSAKDCTPTDDTGELTDDDKRRMKEQCEKTKKEAQESILEGKEGLFVQSDCRVAPGDSGGPLINDHGDLVGLNQSISFDRSSASGTAYHVHVAEIREFIRDAPMDPAQLPPDPWCDGGTETMVEDIDMDGKPDALVATSIELHGLALEQKFALFMDLDEDQTEHDHAAEVMAGKSDMPFDAEVALLSLPVGTFVWYDTDNDGRFDLLLSDPQDKGHPVAAFDIAKDGKLKERPGAPIPFFFDTTFLPKNEVMHEHLGRFAKAINPKFADAELIADGTASFSVPDPIMGIPFKGKLSDQDENGHPDTYTFQTAFERGIVIDVDEDTLGKLDAKDDPGPFIRSRKIDPELSLFVQRSAIWVVYDTNSDGQADLAMIAPPDSGDRIATAAWTRASGGKWTPSTDYVGLRAVRPGLLGMPKAKAMVDDLFTFYARDEGLGTLPAPIPPIGRYEYAEKKKQTNKAVVQGRRGDYEIVLFDPDRDSKLGKETASEAIREKKFDCDVASVQDTDANLQWVFYDTDKDGSFDLVLFTAHPKRGVAERAYRIEGGQVKPDTKAAQGKLYRHKDTFKDAAIGTKFKKLADEFLPSSAIED